MSTPVELLAFEAPDHLRELLRETTDVGGLAGKLQHGYLTEALDALADFDAPVAGTEADASAQPAPPAPRRPS